MGRVLISLVGGRTVPNVLLALHFKPDHLYFIVSQDSMRPGGDYEKTCAALPTELNVHPEEVVRPYALQETVTACQKILANHRADEVIINTTLGPKTMAFGAYDVAKEMRLSHVAVDLCYLSQDGLVWVFKDEIEPVQLKLKDYFASYGRDVEWKTDAPAKLHAFSMLMVERSPISQRLLSKLRSQTQNHPRDQRKFSIKDQLLDDEYQLFQEIEDLQIVNGVTRENQSLHWRATSTEDVDFLLEGDWLEYYVYHTAMQLKGPKGTPLFDEYGWGVKDVSGKGEIDFVGVFSGQAVLISCKTRDIKRTDFEELYGHAEQLGKGMCSTLLVSTVSRSSRSQKDLDEYQKWSRERQIVLVMAEDIPRLGDILKKIVSGDAKAEPREIPYYARI